jgi:signal transduction histidine kinase
VVAEGEHALDLEQQLRRSETLAVAGKLASGIAHEVGTPLNIISGRAEMVWRRFRQGIPAARISSGSSTRSTRVSNIVAPCSMRCGSESWRFSACPSDC